YRFLARLFGNGRFICPVIKANAYGHGDLEVVRTLSTENVSAFGVGFLEEAIRLREAQVKSPILCFGPLQGKEFLLAQRYQIIPVLSSMDQLRQLLELKVPLKCHIKFDTGMHRLGFAMDEAAQVRELLSAHGHYVQVEGFMSHLADGHDFLLNDSFSLEQLRRFQDLLTHWGWSGAQFSNHLFNSQGAVSCYHKFGELPKGMGVRIGIGLYGYLPDLVGFNLNFLLKPVMEIWSRIVHVLRVEPGETVSYGRRWKASRPSFIGVVPFGYADGLSRNAMGRGYVVVRDQKVPIVGAITMDALMCDLTEVTKKYSVDRLLGEPVMLMGLSEQASITALDWARWSDTIVWEVVSRISDRVTRLWVSQEYLDHSLDNKEI
ncbi:MAG: alanine racemase, partial [Pseudobdellovibrionaceae bacterium]|nr:alanine racemase [Pseudobdellovibrionaceae bacterium]